jgi:hypothetical protein
MLPLTSMMMTCTMAGSMATVRAKLWEQRLR